MRRNTPSLILLPKWKISISTAQVLARDQSVGDKAPYFHKSLDLARHENQNSFATTVRCSARGSSENSRRICKKLPRSTLPRRTLEMQTV